MDAFENNLADKPKNTLQNNLVYKINFPYL